MKSVRVNRFMSRGVAALSAAVLLGVAITPAAVAADTTPPSVPAGFTLTPSANQNDGQVTLTWNTSTSTDVAGYRVYRWYGSGTPQISERAFLYETPYTYFADAVPEEGLYKYAVVAYDATGNRSNATAWRSYTFNSTTNGTAMAVDSTAPGKVTDLEAFDTNVQAGTVDLSWSAPTNTNDLWRYLVYRATGSGAASFVGYVDAGISYFTDVNLGENTYTYHVVAQDAVGNLSAASDKVTVTVDNVAPIVKITSPQADLTYLNEGKLAITVNVTENGSGYEASDRKLYVNGVERSSWTIDLASLNLGFHHLRVTVTDRAGNTGSDEIYLNVTGLPAYDAPNMLSASAITNSRSLTINWEAPDQAGVTGYRVYQIGPDGTKRTVGTYSASKASLTTTVSADGAWTYYVTARYGTTEGSPSEAVTFTVDQVAPVVTVTAPEQAKLYNKTGTLVPAYTVVDAVSGNNTSTVELRLDGRIFTATAIDLAALTVGNHTFSVKATDLAGNLATKSVQFGISSTTTTPPDDNNGDDDDDENYDEDDSHDPLHDLDRNVDAQTQQAVMTALVKWRSEIQHGQFTALMAMADAGKFRNMVRHMLKHEGKFISHDAVEEILEILGLDDLQLDAHWIHDSNSDDDSSGSSQNRGKGKDRD